MDSFNVSSLISSNLEERITPSVPSVSLLSSKRKKKRKKEMELPPLELQPIKSPFFLPPELWNVIFSYLDVRSIGRVAQVCKEWNAIVKRSDTMKNFYMKYRETLEEEKEMKTEEFKFTKKGRAVWMSIILVVVFLICLSFSVIGIVIITLTSDGWMGGALWGYVATPILIFVIHITWSWLYFKSSDNFETNPLCLHRPRCCPHMTCVLFFCLIWCILILNKVTTLSSTILHINGIAFNVNPTELDKYSLDTLGFYFINGTEVYINQTIDGWRINNEDYGYSVPEIFLIAPLILFSWQKGNSVAGWALCYMDFSPSDLTNFQNNYNSIHLPLAKNQCYPLWELPFNFGQRAFDIGEPGMWKKTSYDSSTLQPKVDFVYSLIQSSGIQSPPNAALIQWEDPTLYEAQWNEMDLQYQKMTLVEICVVLFLICLFILVVCTAFCVYLQPPETQ